MKRLILLYLMLTVLLPLTKAQDQGMRFEEGKSWTQILDLSKSTGKLIFLDCYTSWCGPCKKMSDEVFPQKEVGEYMNEMFVNVKLDMEKGEGKELHKRYKPYIPAYPTYLIINKDGEVVHQVSGFNKGPEFISKIRKGVESDSWILSATKYYNGERSWVFVNHYLQVLENALQQDVIQSVIQEVLPKLSLADLETNKDAYAIFRRYWKESYGQMLFSVMTAPQIYKQYEDNESDLQTWASKLYKEKVYLFVAQSMTLDYNYAAADSLIEELKVLAIPSRENCLMLMHMSSAVAKKDNKDFLALAQYADTFGLLKNNQSAVGDWSGYLSNTTRNKKYLEVYASYTVVPETKKIMRAKTFSNHAMVLAALGKKKEAAVYFQKAEEARASLEERFKKYQKY